MQNISSEQELKQLLEEGKITEEEYQELLGAIRQKETVQEPAEKPTEPKPKSKFGEAALVLFLLSIVIPVISIILAFVLGAMGVKVFLAVPFIFLGLLCGLLAFIFGIIGWKTAQGKIAAIGVPCLGVLIVPGLFLLSLFSFRKSVIQQEIAEVQAKQREKIEELSSKQLISHKAYPLETLDGVLTQDGVEFDNVISADGNGSLKITSNSDDKTVIRLFETGPMGIDNRMLIYSAKVRVSGMPSEAYLEMWCDIPGKGEFFSRNIEQSVMGTTEWTTVQTPFRLEAGQIPANVKLNLVVEGPGTVWIDDIKLLSSPLN